MIKLGNDEYEIEGYTKLKKARLLLLLLFHCHCLAAHWDSFQESFVTFFCIYDTPAEYRVQNPESSLTQQNLHHNVAFSPDVIDYTS